ncbi:Adenine methyltransferase [Stenotrophomonas maltophilia]
MNRAHPYAARPEAATHTWLTPPEIIAALGTFDLDPCAAPSPRPWPTASRHIELPEDGLTAEWHGRVWCNPPFGRHTEAWLARVADHGNGIALAFARTETAMFQRYVWRRASAVLMLANRPHFHRPDGTRARGNSGGPICLIAYGEANRRALIESGLPGAVIVVHHFQQKDSLHG